MLRDILRDTRDFPYITQEEPAEELREVSLQQAFVQGLHQGRKEMMLELRQALFKIVRARFPMALRLAKKQSISIEDSGQLRDLVVKISIARGIEEAIEYLLEADDEGDESSA